MKIILKYIPALLLIACLIQVSSCEKPNYDDSFVAAKVPPIGNYNSSADVAKENLIAYWSFDTDNAETISGTQPTNAVNNSSVAGIKGNALHLDSGFVLYPVIANLNSANAINSVTISMWINVDNNGAQASSFFALSPPTNADWGGVINMYAETGHPVSTDDVLALHSAVGPYATGSRSSGDNINDYGNAGVDFQTVHGTNRWIQYIMRYDGVAETIDLYANGVRVSNNNFRVRTGLGVIVEPVPSVVLLGGWPNAATGFPASGIQNFQDELTGSIDEIRVYNKALDDNEIHALFVFEKLGS